MSDMFLTLSIYAQKDNPIKEKKHRPFFHSKNAKDKNLTTYVPPLPQNTYKKHQSICIGQSQLYFRQKRKTA